MTLDASHESVGELTSVRLKCTVQLTSAALKRFCMGDIARSIEEGGKLVETKRELLKDAVSTLETFGTEFFLNPPVIDYAKIPGGHRQVLEALHEFWSGAFTEGQLSYQFDVSFEVTKNDIIWLLASEITQGYSDDLSESDGSDVLWSILHQLIEFGTNAVHETDSCTNEAYDSAYEVVKRVMPFLFNKFQFGVSTDSRILETVD